MKNWSKNATWEDIFLILQKDSYIFTKGTIIHVLYIVVFFELLPKCGITFYINPHKMENEVKPCKSKMLIAYDNVP